MLLTRRKVGTEGRDQVAGNNTVVCGIRRIANQNLVGKTVRDVRKQLAAWNIDPDAKNNVSGREVDADYVIRDLDTLEFVKGASTKG